MMGHAEKQEAVRILDEAFQAASRRSLEFQETMLEQLNQMRLKLDTIIQTMPPEGSPEGFYIVDYENAINLLRKDADSPSEEGDSGNKERIRQLESELESARAALVSAELRTASLEEQIKSGPGENYKRHVQNLEENLVKRNETINIARRRILRLQEKIEGMAAEKTAAIQRADDLEMQLERRNTALQSSEERFSELRRKFDLKMSGNEAVNAQLRALEHQIEEKDKALRFADTRLEQVQAKFDAHASELAKYEEREKALVTQLEEQREELEKGNERIESLLGEVHHCQELINQEEKSTLEAKAVLDKADEAVMKSNEQLQEARMQIEAVQQENTSFREKIEHLESDLALRLGEEQNRLGEQDRKNQRIDALEQELQKARELCAQRSGDLDRLNQELERYGRDLEQNTSSAFRIELALTEATARHRETQQQLETLQAEYEKSEKAVSDTRLRVNALESDLSERDALIDRAEKRAETAEDKLERLLSQTGNTEEQVATLVHEVENHKGRVEELELALRQALDDATAAHQTAEVASRNATEARTALQNLADDAEKTEDILRQWKEEKESAEKFLNDMRGDYLQKTAEMESLTSQLSISEQERQESNIALAALREEIEGLRATSYEALSEKDAAVLQIQELSAKIKQIEDALEQSPSAQQLSTLQQQLEEERKRSNLVQEILDEELARGTKAGLARQLADALRDVEKAQEELRNLRKQLDKTPQTEPMVSQPAPSPEIKPSIHELIEALPTEKRKNLGEALVAATIITSAQLAEAMQDQKQRSETSLAAVILDKNMVQEEQLAGIISILGKVPMVDLNTDEMTKAVATLLPERIARMRHSVPIGANEQEIEIAMENPMDLVAIEDIERATNRRVITKVALRSRIITALDKFFSNAE